MCWILEFAKVCCLEQMPCLKYQETETLTTSLPIYILLISLHLSFLVFILPIAIRIVSLKIAIKAERLEIRLISELLGITMKIVDNVLDSNCSGIDFDLLAFKNQEFRHSCCS